MFLNTISEARFPTDFTRHSTCNCNCNKHYKFDYNKFEHNVYYDKKCGSIPTVLIERFNLSCNKKGFTIFENILFVYKDYICCTDYIEYDGFNDFIIIYEKKLLNKNNQSFNKDTKIFS